MRISDWSSDVCSSDLTLILIFPLFQLMANAANPGLAEATKRAPVVVRGSDCQYNPLASKGQATECGRVLDVLSRTGIAYSTVEEQAGSIVQVTIGVRVVRATDTASLDPALRAACYPMVKDRKTTRLNSIPYYAYPMP